MENDDEICGRLDPEVFPKYLVDENTTGLGEGILFTVNFIFTVIGIFANIFGLVFFIKKQRKDLTTSLFICLCAVDLATCITLGPFQMLINVKAINFYDFSTKHFLLFSIISAFSNIEVRFSMFLFMVMSFCRCISILTPFKRQNAKIIVWILALYTVLLTVMCFYPVFVCNDLSYTIVPISRIGQMEFLSALTGGETYQTVYLIFMEILSMILPTIPILATSCVTAYKLICSGGFKTMSQNAKSRFDSAVTILLLTFSTLLCFIPRLAVVMSTLVADITVADRILDWNMKGGYYVLYIFISGLSLANSAINPCIFLARGQNMKIYLRQSLNLAYRRSTLAFRNSRTTISFYSNKTAETDVSNGSFLQGDAKINMDTAL